ncbi:MAG: acetolactate synthase [Lachnospiraceae bacterium]|nr:acetolactate synthase [Lachnospiraceae bacterium]
MYIKQVSVFLENENGRLDDALRILSEGNINILSVCIADTADYGVLRLILGESERGCKILKDAGMAARMDDVIAVVVENEVGSFGKVVKMIQDEGIGIRYIYGLSIPTDGAPIALKTDDQEKTVKVLERGNVKTLSPEDMQAF